LRTSGSRATALLAGIARRGNRSAVIDFDAPGHTASTRLDGGRADGRGMLGGTVPVSPAGAYARHPIVTGPSGTIPLLPGARTPARRLKFAIANACTLASLASGLVAVFLATDGGVGHLRLAALALLACVVLDGCDGGLARAFNVASPFGAQLDSLADLGSFGVATAIVVYEWLALLGTHRTIAAPVCAIVAVCASIRLARFNVSPKDGNYFTGVPTTMVAAVLAVNILIGPGSLPEWMALSFVAVYGLAMITPFPYPKLGRVLRLPLWVWFVPAICAMISVPGTFLGVVIAYLLSGPVLWLLRRGRPRAALAS